MSLKQLFIKIMPFVKPYKWLVVLTLTMTFIGSLAAQVNAVVLDKTVDEVNRLLHLEHFEWSQASYVMMVISAILLGKELLVLLINFVQKYYGERITRA